MFINDNQYFYVYLYRGKSQMGHICPMLANQYLKIFSIFFLFILNELILTIETKKTVVSDHNIINAETNIPVKCMNNRLHNEPTSCLLHGVQSPTN